MKKIIIIDGYSVLFRAYYATAYAGEENILKTSNGTPINAIFTFANMLFPIMQKLKTTDGLIVALDTNKKTKRSEKLPSYKANRSAVPQSLIIQMPLLRDFLDSLNIAHYEQCGFEADDIAGSVAKIAAENAIKVEIYTSDKDYLQLVNENVSVNLIRKGIKDIDEVNNENFFSKFNLLPCQIADYKGLRGDSSDNLKGIPGVGEKTAIGLLTTYKNIEEVFNNVENIKGKLKDKIKENIDSGILCKELATIDSNVELPFGVDELEYQGYSYESAMTFLNKYELKTLIPKLTKIKESLKNDAINTENVKFDEELSFVGTIGIALDYDYVNYHKSDIKGIAIYSDDKNYYFTTSSIPENKKLIDSLKNENLHFCCYDYKAIRFFLKRFDIDLCLPEVDVMLASYLLSYHSEQNYRTTFLDYNVNIQEYNDENSDTICHQIAESSLKLKQKIISSLSDKQLINIYNQMEIPLSRVLCDMEYEGFPLDVNTLDSLYKEYSQKLSDLKHDIILLSGEEFNIQSTKEVAYILFDKLQLPDNKKRSTSIDYLKHLINEHPIVPLILEYRKYQKIISTYINGLKTQIYPDGKLHCFFNQNVTATGRLSSSEPNLQNISIRDEDGKNVRKAFFYEDSSYELISYDYSQIELRILAHVSKCKNLINAFNNGEDIHASTAKMIFEKENITPLERQKAKAVNFGIIYGISPYGLKEQLGIPLLEAKHLIDLFYKNYPEIRQYQADSINFVAKNGYSLTLFNRIRWFKEIYYGDYHQREFAKRVASNVPIQGTAADIIKMAMIRVYTLLQKYDSKLISQIHDELIIKVNVKEKEELSIKIKQIMENVIKLDVPLIVDGGCAKVWYDIK